MRKVFLAALCPLLFATPALAQDGMPTQNGTIRMHVNQTLDNARQNEQGDSPSTPSSPTSNSSNSYNSSKASGAKRVNSSASKLSPLNREALAAARSGLTQTYQEKLSQGANPLTQDESGATALHLSAYKGNAELVQVLVGIKGVVVDARDSAGNTPMQLAVAAGKEDVVAILLKAGADPRLKNGEGVTPLLRAAARGYYPIVTLLLQAGADPLAQDSQGHTAAAIVESQKKGDWEEAARILREAEKNTTTVRTP